jgi:ribosomal protein L22
MPFKRALEILHGLEGQKTHLPKTLYLGRKYYSKSARAIAGVLSALSANARARGLEPENMILMVSAHQGPTMWRARRKALGGRPAARLKLSHVQAVLLSQEQLKMLKPKTFRPKGR